MKSFNEDGQVNADFEKIKIGFHGDVIVERIGDNDVDFESMKKLPPILAYGEHTGHLHKVFGDDVEVRENKEGVKFLKLLSPGTLKHQEHKPVVIPPGTYRIGIQKEFDHFEGIIREVAD